MINELLVDTTGRYEITTDGYILDKAKFEKAAKWICYDAETIIWPDNKEIPELFASSILHMNAVTIRVEGNK